MSNQTSPLQPILLAIAAAVVSGVISALTLGPVIDLIEASISDDLFGLLGSFAVTGGLAFGLCGAAIAVWVLHLTRATAAVFLLTSMFGIAVAVYFAMVSYDNNSNSFVIPYAVGSPLGALIMMGPLAALGLFAHPWRTLSVALVVPTLWAVGVALVMDPDAALEVSGLAALYIGWQAIVLGLFAVSVRRA